MSMNYRSAKKRGMAKEKGRETCTLNSAMGQGEPKKGKHAVGTLRSRMDQGDNSRPYKPTNKIGTSMGQ